MLVLNNARPHCGIDWLLRLRVAGHCQSARSFRAARVVAHGKFGWAGLRASLLIGLLLAMGGPAAGPQVPAPVAVQFNRGCPHSPDQAVTSSIRSADPQLRSLLIEGCRQSPTLRRLADDIGRTDGFVYLTTGACHLRAVRGCLLHTITDTGSARYLWIRISANTDWKELVATMAHELVHALEVLSQSHIRSERDLLEWYRSGTSQAYGTTTLASPFRTFETTAAIEVGTAVRSELADATRMTGVIGLRTHTQ